MVSVMVWSPAHSNKDQHLHSSYQLQHGWCVFCPRHTARIRRTAVDARTPTPTGPPPRDLSLEITPRPPDAEILRHGPPPAFALGRRGQGAAGGMWRVETTWLRGSGEG